MWWPRARQEIVAYKNIEILVVGIGSKGGLIYIYLFIFIYIDLPTCIIIDIVLISRVIISSVQYSTITVQSTTYNPRRDARFRSTT